MNQKTYKVEYTRSYIDCNSKLNKVRCYEKTFVNYKNAYDYICRLEGILIRNAKMRLNAEYNKRDFSYGFQITERLQVKNTIVSTVTLTKNHKRAGEFDESYHYIGLSQDLESLLEYFGLLQYKNDITAAYVKISEGDYTEVWLTESARYYNLEAEYYPLSYYTD